MPSNQLKVDFKAGKCQMPTANGMATEKRKEGRNRTKLICPLVSCQFPVSCALMFSLDATIQTMAHRAQSGRVLKNVWSSSLGLEVRASGPSNGRQTFIIIFVQHFVSPGRAQTDTWGEAGGWVLCHRRGACWLAACVVASCGFAYPVAFSV